MQFTIMIFETADGFRARTAPGASESYWQGTFAFLGALKEAGIFRGGAGLETPETASALRLLPGSEQWTIKDGAVPESSEQLGGYFIIEVPHLDDALRWAARFPVRSGAAIEVRPNLAGER